MLLLRQLLLSPWRLSWSQGSCVLECLRDCFMETALLLRGDGGTPSRVHWLLQPPAKRSSAWVASCSVSSQTRPSEGALWQWLTTSFSVDSLSNHSVPERWFKWWRAPAHFTLDCPVDWGAARVQSNETRSSSSCYADVSYTTLFPYCTQNLHVVLKNTFPFTKQKETAVKRLAGRLLVKNKAFCCGFFHVLYCAF